MSSWRLSAPGAQKVLNGVENRVKIVEELSILTPLWTFGPLGPRGPGNSFRTLFATLDPKDPNDRCSRQFASGTDMTGRPGHRTMEMIGGSSAPHLARTPCVPLFVLFLVGVETEGLLDYQGRAGIISIVRWNLRPVIFGVDRKTPKRKCSRGIATPISQ